MKKKADKPHKKSDCRQEFTPKPKTQPKKTVHYLTVVAAFQKPFYPPKPNFIRRLISED